MVDMEPMNPIPLVWRPARLTPAQRLAVEDMVAALGSGYDDDWELLATARGVLDMDASPYPEVVRVLADVVEIYGGELGAKVRLRGPGGLYHAIIRPDLFLTPPKRGGDAATFYARKIADDTLEESSVRIELFSKTDQYQLVIFSAFIVLDPEAAAAASTTLAYDHQADVDG